MARCAYCGQEMTTAKSCALKTVEFPDGVTYPGIPFQSEFGERCHDCGVTPGGFHHPGCDMEICPKCGGQLISCGCLDEQEEETDWEDIDWTGGVLAGVTIDNPTGM